jgi:hypothetical protein
MEGCYQGSQGIEGQCTASVVRFKCDFCLVNIGLLIIYTAKEGQEC